MFRRSGVGYGEGVSVDRSAASARAGASRGAPAVLVACAVVLGVGFVVGPRALVGGGFADEEALREGFRAAFVEYWGAGGSEFTPDLAAVVDYWFRYHSVKAVFAAGLVIALVALGVLLWKGFLRVGGGVRAMGGVGATAGGLVSLVLVIANVQGAVAPFASLFPMLTGEGGPNDTLDQVREQLSTGGPSTPALETMVGGFARYHVAMAMEAGVLAVAFLGLSVVLWMRFAKTAERRTKHVLGAYGALATLLMLGVIVVAVANTTNAADPEAGLLALFSGGW